MVKRLIVLYVIFLVLIFPVFTVVTRNPALTHFGIRHTVWDWEGKHTERHEVGYSIQTQKPDYTAPNLYNVVGIWIKVIQTEKAISAVFNYGTYYWDINFVCDLKKYYCAKELPYPE